MATPVAFVLALAVWLTLGPRSYEYHRDIAPILDRRCRGCHQAEGNARWPRMSDYHETVMNASRIRRAVANRAMPPWLVDNTGLCGTWKHAQWLPDEDIETLVKWFETGAREGDGIESKEPVNRHDEVFRRDASVDIGGEYVLDLGPGAYRCFVADPGLRQPSLLAAMRVVASDPRGLHQVTLYQFASVEAQRAMEARQQEDGIVGVPCYGTPAGVQLVGSAALGDSVVRLAPEGGVALAPDRMLVIQVRFNVKVTGRPYRTRLAVELELAKDGPSLAFVPVELTSLAPPLPADTRFVTATAGRTFERPVRILGLVPRMHSRGRALRVGSSSPTQCLATVDEWMLLGERYYEYAEPRRIGAGQSVQVHCSYSTQGTKRLVGFGEGIEDEECSVFLLTAQE